MSRRLGILVALAPLAACTLLVPIDDDLMTPELDGAPSDGALSDGGADGAEASSEAGEHAEACPSTDPDLVAWFPFDEDGGTNAKDCSKNAIAAYAIGGSPTWAEGRIGGAIELDGANSCFELPEPERFAFEGKPFTIAAWIWPRRYTEANGTGRYVAIHKQAQGWHFGTDDGERLELDFDFPDAGKMQISGKVPLTTWTHVAAAYAPGEAIVWINGVRTERKTAPPLFGSPQGTPFHLGCKSPGVNHFDGRIDDVRIWSRVLGDLEIRALVK